jgi:hypothetical protein
MLGALRVELGQLDSQLETFSMALGCSTCVCSVALFVGITRCGSSAKAVMALATVTTRGCVIETKAVQS